MYLDKKLAIDLATINLEARKVFDSGSRSPELKDFIPYKAFLGDKDWPGGPDRAVSVYKDTLGKEKLLVCIRDGEHALEWKEKMQSSLVSFQAFESSEKIDRNVLINEFFYEKYNLLRKELFELIDAVRFQELIITGHGFGAALATLFVYDLGITRPYLPITCVLFGSPKVGNFGFTFSFDNSVQQLRTPLIRISNQKDWLTYLPFEENGYRHVGKPYEFCFYKKDIAKESKLYMMTTHKMENYLLAAVKHFQLIDQSGFSQRLFDEIIVADEPHYYRDEQIKSEMQFLKKSG